jgi:hypothetical protein
LFLPVEPQDLEPLRLQTDNLFYIRSDSFPRLLKLIRVQGCLGLYTAGDSGRSQDAIPILDSDVQEFIKIAQEAHQRIGEGVGVGSFVRVLNGELRGFCGVVQDISHPMATVKIELLDRLVVLETPIRNLKCLDSVPAERRTWCYGPEVEELEDVSLLELYLKFDPNTPDVFYPQGLDDRYNGKPATFDDGVPHDKQANVNNQTSGKVTTPHKSRVSHRVRELIAAGQRDPFKIISKVVSEIKAGKCHPVKNILVIRHIIGNELLRQLGRQPRQKKNVLMAKLQRLSKSSGIPYATCVSQRPSKHPKVKLPTDHCKRVLCNHQRQNHKKYGNGYFAACKKCSCVFWRELEDKK